MGVPIKEFEMTIKTGKRPCGFCLINTHEYCPGAISQKEGAEVILCPCGCSSNLKCLVCGNLHSDDINPDKWVCRDAAACMREVDRKRQETRDRLFPQSRIEQPKPKTGPECHCRCGETTGGGKFRPGHDSRYVADMATRVKAGELTADQAKDEVSRVSAGLLQKLARKI